MTGVDLAFWFFGTLSVITSILVIANRNPVASVLFLVVTFFCVAALFVTLHSHFLAAIQILVYAGAIMVLFLFVVMLLNLGTPQWFDIQRWPLTVVAGALGVAFVGLLWRGGLLEWAPGLDAPAVEVPPDVLGSVEAVGTVLYTVYAVPFLATALLLLVAMVGAVVIARRER